MKRFSQTIHSISIIWCAVLIYSVLAALSAGCALAHADQSQSHHHGEGNSSSQHALCAWACQATSDIDAVTQPPVPVAWLVIEQPVLAPDSFFVSSAFAVLRPRSPPSTGFLSHG